MWPHRMPYGLRATRRGSSGGSFSLAMPTPAVTLVGSTTINSTPTTVDFTLGVTTGPRVFGIQLTNVAPTNDNVSLSLTLSDDAGTTYDAASGNIITNVGNDASQNGLRDVTILITIPGTDWLSIHDANLFGDQEQIGFPVAMYIRQMQDRADTTGEFVAAGRVTHLDFDQQIADGSGFDRMRFEWSGGGTFQNTSGTIKVVYLNTYVEQYLRRYFGAGGQSGAGSGGFDPEFFDQMDTWKTVIAGA